MTGGQSTYKQQQQEQEQEQRNPPLALAHDVHSLGPLANSIIKSQFKGSVVPGC